MPKRQAAAVFVMTFCLAGVAQACVPLPDQPPPRGRYELELRVVRAQRPHAATCRFRAEVVTIIRAPDGARLPRVVDVAAACFDPQRPPPCPLADAIHFSQGRRFRALLEPAEPPRRGLRVVERTLRPL